MFQRVENRPRDLSRCVPALEPVGPGMTRCSAHPNFLQKSCKRRLTSPGSFVEIWKYESFLFVDSGLSTASNRTMYVCICEPVTESDIHQAVSNQGCASLRDLRRTLGCCGDCGRCARHAKAVLDEALDSLAPCDAATCGEQSSCADPAHAPKRIARPTRNQHERRQESHPVS